MTKNDQFEAADSANGYFYQVEYALWLALSRSIEDATFRIAIESLDDVVFAKDKGPTDLVQVKYRVRSPGNLTNASEDLWKTLRIWSEGLRNSSYHLPGTSLLLVTTQTAAPDTVAGWLTPAQRGARNPEAALAALENTARTSKSDANQKAYQSFLSLTPPQRSVLVHDIVVLDKAPNSGDLGSKIRNALVRSVDRTHVESFHERLFGWWMLLVTESLHQTDRRFIAAEQLEAKVADLREDFRRTKLPVDYLFYEAAPDELADKQRNFIFQVQLIMLNDKSIEYAIRDYYAAYHQRSKWLREGLVSPDELGAYEKRLVDEWGRYFESRKGLLPDGYDNDAAIGFGREVYHWVNHENDIRLRPLLEAPYVRRGSYHMLADTTKVGWHPDFVVRLAELLAEK